MRSLVSVSLTHPNMQLSASWANMDGGVVAVRHGHVLTPVISVSNNVSPVSNNVSPVSFNVSPSQIIVSINVSQKHR